MNCALAIVASHRRRFYGVHDVYTGADTENVGGGDNGIQGLSPQRGFTAELMERDSEGNLPRKQFHT